MHVHIITYIILSCVILQAEDAIAILRIKDRTIKLVILEAPTLLTWSKNHGLQGHFLHGRISIPAPGRGGNAKPTAPGHQCANACRILGTRL